MTKQLPIPTFFDEENAKRVFRVPYEERAKQAYKWATDHSLQSAAKDRVRICLMPIDCQNTFCLPDFELFVGGRSGTGAVDDNIRLCNFIYRELGVITEIAPTMDTHKAMQVFHAEYLINDAGEHPAPMTFVSVEDVLKGVWKVNPAISQSVARGNYVGLQRQLQHYCQKLKDSGKYLLCIWPYHAMLGGLGHALVAAVEEACFFHCLARHSQTKFEIKGGNPLRKTIPC